MRSGLWFIGLSVLLGAIIVGGFTLYPRPPANTGAVARQKKSSSSEAGTQVDVDALRRAAFERQIKRQWCDAEEAWAQVQQALAPRPAAAPDWLAEANANRQLCESLCPKNGPEDEGPVAIQPNPNDRPESRTAAELLRHYPVGRATRGFAYMDVTGSGFNAAWVFKQQTQFAYRYRAIVDTRVLENRQRAVVFEQHIREVVQTRALSEQTLELAPPTSPIVNIIWGELEKNLLAPLPGYAVARRLVDIGNVIDPNFKSTLTTFANQLERHGVKVTPDDDVELAMLIDKLSGVKFRIEYVTGLGVTSIEEIETNIFRTRDLEKLALHSSMLMDLFVSDAAAAPPGKIVDLRAKDIASVLGNASDVAIDGHLSLRREPNPGDAVPWIALEVVGGEVALRGTVNGIERLGRLKPQGGYLRYSPVDLLVHEARIGWTADASWVSPDHLLFGTQGARNVKMTSYYQGGLIGDNDPLQDAMKQDAAGQKAQP